MGVVIVGGGITGLAALEHISRVTPAARVTLLEAAPRLGGHIRTVRHDDFIMEAGPDVLLTAKPAALDLARRAGLGDRIVGTNPAAKGSYILRDGRLLRIPDGMTGLVPSRFAPFVTTPLVSPLGKVRVALEYLIPPRRGDRDESIETFVVRRLGREMYQNLVEPLLSGISAGDGARLSIDSMFPQLREYERAHGGLIRGMFAAKRQAKNRRRGTEGENRKAAFASFPSGLQELVDAVESTVRARDPRGSRIDIQRDARVKRISRVQHTPYANDIDEGSRYVLSLANGDVVLADALIICTPAHVTAPLVRELSADLASQLDAIQYASTVTISLAYPIQMVPRPLDATGYVVPRIEKRPVLACTWSSVKFVGRSPANQALFRLFVGGVGRGHCETCSDEGLLDIAKDEMRDVMGIDAAPVLTRIERFDRAMPQYTVGHRARMANVMRAAALVPRLELAGAVYGGIGIPDCVRSGIEAAERTLTSVAADAPSRLRTLTSAIL